MENMTQGPTLPVEPQPSEKRYFRFAGNPRYYIWGLIIILALVGVYTTLAVNYNLWPFQTEKQIVGNDRDAHGCIGSAGYSWCEAKQKCLRIWEESCETASSTPTQTACTEEAKICPDGSAVGRTGPNCEFALCPTGSTIQSASVSDLIKKTNQFADKEVQVSGKLVLTSKNFWPSPEFGISDGSNVFAVTSWLPYEIAPPPPGTDTKGIPGSMQDVLDKNVILQGVVKNNPNYYLEVQNGVLQESGGSGQFCGGFAGYACPAGYICQLDGSYPDAGGTCIIVWKKNEDVCIQIPVQAKNTITGEIYGFPTPCSVPDGWEIIK